MSGIRSFWRFLLLTVTPVLVFGTESPRFSNPLPDFRDRVTGSFGEFRWEHLHAGIDIGTNLKIGLPVVAADSGYVAWVSSSDTGYGKALLLRHPSGFSTFYAHLDDFSPRIKAHIPNQPVFSKDFLPGEIPVQAGEVIALSGESGSGFPHLHFEIHFGGQRLNPLQFGLGPPDSDPPVAQRLYLIPADAFSGVPRIFSFPENRQNTTTVLRIPVSGRFWVELEAYDRGAANTRLVPSTLLVEGGDYCYSLNLDSFRVPSSQRFLQVYNPAASHLSPTHYTFRLYDLSSSTCSPIWSTSNPLNITLSDPAGNTSRYRVISDPHSLSTATGENPNSENDVLLSPAFSGPEAPPILGLPSGLFVRVPPDRNFRLSVRNEILLRGTSGFPPSGAVLPMASFPFPAPGELRLLAPLPGNSKEVVWQFVSGEASTGQSYSFAIGGFQFSLSEASLHRPITIAAVKAPIPFLPAGLHPVSDAVYLSPYGEPLSAPLKVKTAPGLPITPKSGIYKLDAFARRWKVLAFFPANNSLRYDAPYFATFAVLDDESPPEIRDLYSYRNRLAIPISDLGLGVDPSSIVITFGKEPISGEWDPDWQHFLTDLPATDLPPEADLLVRVSDRAQNRSERSFPHPVRVPSPG